MPPKRKAQEISRAESSPPANVRTKGEAVTGGPDTPIRGELAPLDLSSPWTDDQEIALFKSVIRWKPAGMHKHFRMLSISQQIQNQAYDESEATDTHIRIPGIWQKLGTLYNLEAIDSREDSFQEEGRDDGSTDSDPHEEPFHEFILPEEEYGDSMFDRRLNPEGTSSPPLLEKRRSPARKRGGRRAEGNTSARASTIEDTEEEAKSSPVPSRGRRGRGRGTKSGPRSRLQQEANTRSGYGESESVSVIEDSVGTDEDADEEEQEDDDEGGDGDEEESMNAGSLAAGTTGARRRGGRGGSTRSRGRGGRAGRRGGRRR